MSTIDSVKEKIENILKETIFTSNGEEYENLYELSLIEEGILDSMAIVNLVQALQDEFDIEIEFADITMENFDHISYIVAFIRRITEVN